MVIELVPPGEALPSVVDGLADVLLDAVADGVSVGFPASLTVAEARDWWRTTLLNPVPLTWVAREQDQIVGSVRLVPESFPSGAHRAEVTKFLVRSDVRGRGHGRGLMEALEAAAADSGRRLLLLDTETGALAESIYERWGWQRYGFIDDFAAGPDGKLGPASFLYKRL
jgi:acetyltransferase